jgi:NAD(P)-dependent dehydrogenase (short-subunit alcohol dehydrogenase family)
MKQLSDKFALITGASQGLGRELALAYAREDVRGLALVALEACGGHLDILVNNASTVGPVPIPYLLDYPVDDFQQVLNVNLVAPLLLIQNLLAAMIDHSGSIINVTSDAGRVGYPGWGAYGISKFGLEGLSQTWAAELAETPVRVNWVDPGNMNTATHREAEPDEDPTAWADPAAVTDIFVFLASEASRHVRGKRLEAQSNASSHIGWKVQRLPVENRNTLDGVAAGWNMAWAPPARSGNGSPASARKSLDPRFRRRPPLPSA